MKKIYLLVSLVISTLSFGQTTHLNDAFNYADLSLLTANGWTAHSGTTNFIDVGTSNGLTYTGYNDGVSSITGATPGNAARLDNTGEDDNKVFSTPVTTGSTIYLSCLINVANASTGYFMHLSPTATTTQVSKVFVRPSAVTPATKFNIGISNTATAVYGATELDLNTTYLVIIKYDDTATGAVSLWIKSTGIPASEGAAGVAEVSTSGSGNAAIDRICLRQYSATQNQTVDAVFVSSTWLGTAACALSLGSETATCNAITLAVDTYNVTIPFTGGNSGAYTLSSNVGTIGGDNPNTLATGNITITGITEGTTLNFSITGGCTLSKTVLSPNCKPINVLPLSEPFNYAPATTLNSTQMWTVANAGDDIVTEAGNLTYTGITSTGNRATFAGVGAESRTPFTSTTTGSVYARFLNSVTDLTGITVGGITYSALFTDNAGATTNARIWIRENAGQYQYGLSPNSTGASVVWSPNLYSVGTTQYLLFSYDFATNTLALFENPTLGSTANVSVSLNLTVALANIGGFMLRQDTALLTPITIVDELYIDTVVPDALTLSRNNFNTISGLNIYPNPAKNFLNITSSSLEAKTVAIYNVLGAQVLTANVTNAPINIATLSKGVYVVKVTEEGKTATRKLVIE